MGPRVAPAGAAQRDIFWYNDDSMSLLWRCTLHAAIGHWLSRTMHLLAADESWSRRCGCCHGLKEKLMADFQTVKGYLQELNLNIVSEEPTECILVVEDDERGIKNLVVDCEDPILIFEQMIMEVPANPKDMFRRLLQMNRTLVHGSFVLTEDGKHVLFRDTLRLEHLDPNEVQGTVEALSLAMAEYATELIAFHQ
jgi:hypothetical protein